MQNFFRKPRIGSQKCDIVTQFDPAEFRGTDAGSGKDKFQKLRNSESVIFSNGEFQLYPAGLGREPLFSDPRLFFRKLRTGKFLIRIGVERGCIMKFQQSRNNAGPADRNSRRLFACGSFSTWLIRDAPRGR